MRGSRRELLVLVAGQIGLAVLSLGFLQILLYVLDATAYGTFMFVFSTALTLSMLLFNPGIVPVTRVAANSPDGDRSGGMIADCLAVAALPAVLICAAIAGAVLAASGNLPAATVPATAAGVGFLTAGTGIIALTSAFAQGRRRRILNVGLNNGVITLRIVLILAAMLAGLVSPGAMLGAVALAGCAVALIALVVIRVSQAWTPVRTAIAALAAQGFFRQYRQNWPLLAGSTLFQHGDKVILGFVLPLEVLGLLAVYQQIARVLVNTTIGAIQQYLAPFLLSGDADTGRNLRASLLAMVCMVPVAGAVAVLIPWIGTTLLHGVFDLSPGVFLAVCLVYALLRASQINELAFFRADRVGLLLLPLVVAIGIFLVAGPLLAAKFGLWGAVAGLLGATAIRYGWVLRVMGGL